MLLDLHNDIEVRRAISPLTGTDDTAFVSQIIDMANRTSLEFVIATGTLADVDATFTALVEHGDNSALSDAAAVPDADLLGTEAGAGFTFGDDNETRKIGYIGDKRYVRLTVTPENNTGSAPVSAVAILGGARKQPQSSQG